MLINSPRRERKWIGEIVGSTSEAARKLWEDPEYREKQTKAVKKAWEDPELIKKQRDTQKRYYEIPENRNKMSELVKKSYADNPEYRIKVSVASKKYWESPESKEKASEVTKQLWADPKFVEKHNSALSKAMESPECKEKISKNSKMRWDNHEYRERLRESHKRWWADPENRKKQGDNTRKRYENIENRKKTGESSKMRWADPDYRSRVGKILSDRNRTPEAREKNCEAQKKRYLDQRWFGTVSYPEDQLYCELFYEVDPRVRAFQGDRCLLCSKPEMDNNGWKLSNHHIFYVKKTCCWSDESGEYWTNLNVKNHSQKDYYIGKNPNYFALLCHSCHSKTNGNFETRKKYADILRDLIDTKFGGKSYYTEEEMVEHGYRKISRCKWIKDKQDINIAAIATW